MKEFLLTLFLIIISSSICFLSASGSIILDDDFKVSLDADGMLTPSEVFRVNTSGSIAESDELTGDITGKEEEASYSTYFVWEMSRIAAEKTYAVVINAGRFYKKDDPSSYIDAMVEVDENPTLVSCLVTGLTHSADSDSASFEISNSTTVNGSNIINIHFKGKVMFTVRPKDVLSIASGIYTAEVRVIVQGI